MDENFEPIENQNSNTEPSYGGQMPNDQPNMQNFNNGQPVNEKKGLAIASMVLGIIALVLLCVWYISIPCGILAIVFGIISKKKTKSGMAVAGFVTGIIAIALWAVLFFLSILGLATISSSGLFDELNSVTTNSSYNSYY